MNQFIRIFVKPSFKGEMTMEQLLIAIPSRVHSLPPPSSFLFIAIEGIYNQASIDASI